MGKGQGPCDPGLGSSPCCVPWLLTRPVMDGYLVEGKMGELRREGARKGVILGVFLFLPLSSCLLVKGSMSGKEGQIVNTSQRS